MRYKFYKRAIGQMKHKKFIALIFILVFAMVYLCINLEKEIIPAIKIVSESKAEATALAISSEVIEEHMTELEYNNLMQLNYSSDGKITTINANVSEMNKLSAKIIKEIQDRILQVKDVTIEIPLGKILGWSIFAGYGPKLNIKLMPAGNVKANFKTDFVEQGINQTKHTIYIEISVESVVIAPFISDTVTAKSTLAVAETIIVGDIPNTYFGIDENGYIGVNKTGN